MSEGMLNGFKGKWAYFKILMQVHKKAKFYRQHEKLLIERGIKPQDERRVLVKKMKKGFEEVLSSLENPTNTDKDWEKCFRKLDELVDREQALLEDAKKKYGSLTKQELRALFDGKLPKAPWF